MSKTRVLIIEDEENIRRLLKYDLKQLDFEVSEATNGQEGLEKSLSGDYDVLIVDWMLPKLSGIEIVRQYRQENLKGIVFMVTAKSNEEDLLEAFEAGVDDYVTKPFSPRELSARIQAQLKRYYDSSKPKQIEFGNTVINLDLHQVMVGGEKIELTKKEFDLFYYMIRNMNAVLSRDMILSEVWDFSYDGDTRIVDVHVFKLRTKLEDSDIVIESLRGVGYAAKTE